MKHISVLFVAGFTAISSSVMAAKVDLTKLPPSAKQDGVTYAKDIRLIFETSCLRCHGAERPKAGLRLDSLEGALKGSKERKVIIPGKSTESPLVIAVARLDDETAMPPKPRQGGSRRWQDGSTNTPPNAPRDGKFARRAEGGTNQPPGGPRGQMGPPPKPLTPEQVGLIRAWVDQGAK